ncbi:peptidylprolyl isomerase [Denitratimonas sp. CY0512]|uniref:peptidylprolyl isomerase n=1 Tax=Denitratimonas sp. CY0512 TaxID=3131940 RepID=UPI0030B10FA9
MVYKLFFFILFPFSETVFSSEAEPVGYLPDDAVVAERGGVSITMGDLRAKLRSGLSEDAWSSFYADGTKVASMVDELLTARQMAEDARKAGLDKSSEILADIRVQTEELLARRHLANHMASLEEPDYEVLAKERYIARKDEYSIPATRDVRHILVMAGEQRSAEDAKDIAEQVYNALKAGSDFDEVFEEYSDDPNVDLVGWVRGVNHKDFDPVFTEAVFGMRKVGEVSQPILSRYGYHVIRYEQETPARVLAYEEVKEEIITKIRAEFRFAARQDYVGKFMSEPLRLNDETMKVLPTLEY